MRKCIIVGAGEFFYLNTTIEDDTYIIAADGGYDNLVRLGIVPNLIIGDMDSTDVVSYPDNIKRIQLPCEKDDTDTIAAIKEGLALGYKEFELFGAMGGRLDHTLANIQTLMFIKKHNANGIIFGKEDSLELLSNERKDFHHDMEGMISIFAYGGKALKVTEKGLKYEIEDVTLDCDMPIGVSNEFKGIPSYVEVREGNILVYVHKIGDRRK